MSMHRVHLTNSPLDEGGTTGTSAFSEIELGVSFLPVNV